MRHKTYAQVKFLHKQTYMPNFWNRNRWKCFLETSYVAVLKYTLNLHRKPVWQKTKEFFTFQMLKGEKITGIPWSNLVKRSLNPNRLVQKIPHLRIDSFYRLKNGLQWITTLNRSHVCRYFISLLHSRYLDCQATFLPTNGVIRKERCATP